MCIRDRPDELRPAFTDELKARLRAAYPVQLYGTVLPFRRVFVVAQRTGRSLRRDPTYASRDARTVTVQSDLGERNGA